jgi:hypothetical protein
VRDRGPDWYRRPELILADLIRSHAQGDDRGRHYRRAVVVAVDLEGAKLQNESGSGSVTVRLRDGQTKSYPALPGVDCPRGSVKARILTDGLDRLLADEDLRVFWPMFPQDQLAVPISPGEHVYVVFEDEGLIHGLWISRVPGHDSANAFLGVDSYSAPSSPGSAMDSFEPNDAEYDRTDEHAGLAPPVDSTSFFEGGA